MTDHCKKKLKTVLSAAAKSYVEWAKSIGDLELSSKARAAVFREHMGDALMAQDKDFLADLVLDLIHDSDQVQEGIKDACEKVRKEVKR